jgi:hypothetical protein
LTEDSDQQHLKRELKWFGLSLNESLVQGAIVIELLYLLRCVVYMNNGIPERVLFFGWSEQLALKLSSTTSQFNVFKSLTEEAQSALLWFINRGDAFSSLLSWISSLSNLYSSPCVACGQRLSIHPLYSFIPPTFRSYRQPHLPYHPHCKQ